MQQFSMIKQTPTIEYRLHFLLETLEEKPKEILEDSTLQHFCDV